MRIAIVGATGEVGRMMLKVLSERDIKGEFDLYASARSAGSILSAGGEEIEVRRLTPDAMKREYDYILFSAGSGIAREYARIAEDAGNTVIDNSSAFRKTHPLIVPEINGHLLENYRGIVANPNCSTIQLVLALYPLHLRYSLEELVISTYQSVSGAGFQGIKTLMSERAGVREEGPFPRDIDLNVIPQIGDFDDDGYSEEENKMIFEIRKILGTPELLVAVTTVRVPVLYGHAESVFLRCKERIRLTEVTGLYRNSMGIEHNSYRYLTPKEIGDSELSHVSRIRRGADEHTLLLWNVAHNVRLGAATNAIKIMEQMITFRETRKI